MVKSRKLEKEIILKKNLKEHTVVRFDSEGNVISSDLIGEYDSVKYVKPPKENSKQTRIYKKNQEKLGKLSTELGGFYMLYYNDSLFDNKIDVKHICRIIFLATFLEYDTNRLVKRDGRINKPLTEKDIKKELRLDKKTYKSFKDEMLNNDIMTIDESGIYLSINYFKKGNVIQDGRNFSRVYVNTVRELYYQISGRQHKTLSHLFRLLPYCDYEYNTISMKPNTEEALDTTLTKEDIAELLNLDLETYKKLERSLMDLKITLQGDTYYVMGSVTFGRGRDKKHFYVVNPLIYNSGSSFESLHSIWAKLLKV